MAMHPDSIERRWVLVLLVLVGIGAAIAAVSGLATSWDGPAYLWSSLDNQSPFSPNRRYINVLLQLPVLAASRLTTDGWLLETVFGLAYASMPLIVLAASAWTVRPHLRLLVWPALGIGLLGVMATANATSEAVMATLLFWPALLAMMVGMQPRRSLVAIFLAAMSIIAHPFAIATLGTCAVASALRGSRAWAVLFGAGALAAVARLVWLSVPYERDRLGGGSIEEALPSLLGQLTLPAAALALAGSAALVFAWRGGRRRTGIAAVTMLSGSAVLYLAWAASPSSLLDGFYLRSPLPLFMAALAVLALFNEWQRSEPASSHWRATTTAAIVLGGATFMAVTALQAAHWHVYRQSLLGALAAAEDTCVPLDSVAHMPGMGSPFWTETQYSVTVQGRVVHRIAEPDEVCESDQLADEVPISFIETRPYGAGWFELEALRPAE